MPRPRADNAQYRFDNASTVSALFELAHEIATSGLDVGDLAALSHTDTESPERLQWIPTQKLKYLRAYLEQIASAELSRRYVLNQSARKQIARILGAGFLEDPRRCFLLAVTIDQSFVRFPRDSIEQTELIGDPRITSCPDRLYDETDNPPPPLGQMTPLAICRRWLRNFWVIGDLSGARGVGRFPRPVRAVLPARTELVLQSALAEGPLRVATFSWRWHEPEDLLQSQDVPQGTFAILGYRQTLPDSALPALVETAAQRGAHLVLLPELALSPDELAGLQTYLKNHPRRFPVLIVVGSAHRKTADGYVNEAVVLDRTGNILLRHEKIEPYTDKDFGLEAIVPRQSDAYGYLDTPAGRLVVNVCRDFRSDVPMILNRLLGATLMLVPSYSRKLDFVGEEARILGQRQGAVTVAVNPGGTHLKHAAVVYAPIRGDDSLLTVRQDRPRLDAGGLPAFMLLFELATTARRGSLTRISVGT